MECGSRVRVTLDRSSTGKGRRREVDVWERGLQVSPDELEKECSRRDRKISEQGSLVEEGASETPQQTDLPTIYARNWKPSSGLEFSHPLQSLRARGELLRFIAERHDGYLELVAGCWDEERAPASFEGDSYHEFCLDLLTRIGSVLSERILEPLIAEIGESEVIPRRSGTSHLSRRNMRFLLDIRICLRRIAYESSITLEQRKQWQRWMTRTRVTDEHLKELFTDGVPTPDGGRFGGKGFRSTWQEGIVACASAMNRAVDSPQGNGGDSDIIAPMIRDMGLALAMGQTPLEVLSAQMGKSGSYMDGGNEGSGGRDLHIGNWEKGILPPTAPLPIASATTTGVALASHRLGLNRFHLAPVGEGCSSSGEFWEAMNLAGTRGLPICYMIQNNQIALDTFVVGQSGAETFGDKGHAMGIPSWTIDGSDPSQFYSSVCVAREIAVSGGGATLIHVETMRGCGHAHHHDDLYLGSISGTPPGYVDRELISYWSEKDPLPNHRNLLIGLGASEKELQAMESEERAFVEDSRAAMEEMPWPEGNSVGEGVTSIYDARSHAQQFDTINTERQAGQSKLESGRVYIEFSDASNSWTFSRSIQNAMVELAEKYGEQIIFMGEDMEVAGAFGMNLPLRAKGHQSRLLDMPLSESIIINSATGAALGGMRPVAEIQFGGFAALAMNPLINNAAQLRWRWGADVPMTVRIPLGAKTRLSLIHI